MSLLSRVLERRGADPTLPWGDSAPPPPGMSGGYPVAGVQISEESILGVTTVYACVRILADGVSTMPFEAVRQVGVGVYEPATKQPQIMADPSPEWSAQQMISQEMVSCGLRGNFYAMIAGRDRLGYATQLFPLHPDQVKVRRNRDSGLREYSVNGTVVPTDDVFHIPAMMVPGGLEGLSPLRYARLGFGLALATDEYAAAFFANSAAPSGVIQVPGSLPATETKRLANEWKAMHGGIKQAHLPAVLTGGATWQQVSINPDDAQFLQTRQASQHDIAMWYGIPEHMLGMQDRTSSWGTGIEQMSIGFVRYTLRSWASRIEDAYSRLLPDGLKARFDFSELLRGDTLQRYQAYTLGRNGGWLNLDEIRADEGRPPIPGGLGQDHFAPMNFQPLDQFSHIPPTSGGGGEQAPSAPVAP